MTLLAQMDWTQSLLAMVLIGICLFMILVILLQKGRGEGLAGAFGGGGGSGAFGAKTGDVFTWITVVVAGLFIMVSVMANYAFDQTPEKPAARTITIPIGDLEPAAAELETLPVTTDGDAGGASNTDQPSETDEPGDG